ncbi:hypothetical protein D3C73_405810 [compost metagenome]
MQTPPSTSTSTETLNSTPTTAQIHQSQLDDYELLLSFLRAEVGSMSHFARTLLRPCTLSPLDQENEAGQTALQDLMKDSKYQALCKSKNVSPHYLIVTAKDGTYVYETSNRDDQNKVVLALTGSEKWSEFKARIEKTAKLLGGQIRYDRLVSLPGMATFYGLAPWDPTNSAEHQAAINALEEKIASYRLKLEDDFNIVDLKRPPSAKDRKVFNVVRAASSDPSSITMQKVQEQIIGAETIETIRTFLPEAGISPFTHLANDTLMSATAEQIRATPTVFLEKILQNPEAEKLATGLLSTLNWYGGAPGEETSPHIRIKVIANALQIWFETPSQKPEEVAGFDWQSRSHWGKSYPAIRNEFETHLLRSKRAASEKEAIVMARLFLHQFPVEFRVTDIPTALPYRSSLVWVNFMNGVNLINATDPEALCRMTFQHLVNLALDRAEGATDEQLKEVSLARLLPTLDWAVTQGIILPKRHEDYTEPEIELALSELDKHTNALGTAITRINETPPNRLSMAKTVAEKFFGKRFVAQNRKLARKERETIRWNSVPTLRGKGYDRYSLIDILASNEFDEQTRWYYTQADGAVSQYYFRIDSNRKVASPFYWEASGIPAVYGILPEVKSMFYDGFLDYFERQTTAYKTLIRSQLASLPFDDRQAIEWGELKIHSLRKETSGVEAQNETPEIILPLRARNGLILQTTYAEETRTYELLPRAGVIRRVENPDPEQFGGVQKTETWRMNKGTVSVSVLRNQTLPFDWDAHSIGSAPNAGAVCEAIIEQLGDTFTAPSNDVQTANSTPLTLSSPRCLAISHFIASLLPFVDPKQLYKDCAGQTEFEREKAEKDEIREVIKIFVPFWKSIEDLASGEKTRLINGVFGVFIDLLSFAQPIGKFASGSTKLISNAGRLTLRARLPAFKLLTKEFLILSLMALNPLDGIGALLKALGSKGLKIGRSGIFRIKELAGSAGHYNFSRSLPQVTGAGRWKPLVNGDQLTSLRGLDDVPVRNLSSSGKARYYLVDPLSSKPYGPLLRSRSREFSLGRSHYSPLEKTKDNVIVELADKSSVREVLEVDGRTTLFIDDQPYRLKDDVLRRADLMDLKDSYKAAPCRIRRMPGSAPCKTSYVIRDPAPTPDIGSFDTAKGWAPWFGDVTYIPATNRAAMQVDAIRAHSTLQGTMEFQKGIYGRVMVSVPVPGEELVDNFHIGSIIVEAADGSKHYVFTRLNAGDYYFAERASGHGVHDLLTFKKADTLPDELKNELLVVYTGSLNANNMVRIHGQASVERALKAMDEIAIPIGGHANPPETLKWLKVDTSPGEAALFDHSTRMIIRFSTDGAATWSLSKAAPDSARETTAEIFNNLFEENVITVASSTQAGPKALKIDDTMRRLQRLISKKTRRPLHKPRNIAFAEIKTKAGGREVYVSVSGNKGDTGFLPLFANNRHTNEVKVGSTSYFNIDHKVSFPQTALEVSPQGKLQAIPRTINDIETYTPALTSRPTSLDTESKLISVIRGKYPNPKDLDSITIATALAPCESCSVVMKQFGYDGSADALGVIWK